MDNSGIENYNHLVSSETFSRVRRLHKEFVDEMHLNFGVTNPTYVENIQFIKIFGGGYGFDERRNPVIYFSELFAGEHPEDDGFGPLNLDTIMLHESAHHLHIMRHGVFGDEYTLELIIDYSKIHFLKLKGMQKHIEVLTGDTELLAKELYDRISESRPLESILTLNQEEARKFLEGLLGADHDYFLEPDEDDNE